MKNNIFLKKSKIDPRISRGVEMFEIVSNYNNKEEVIGTYNIESSTISINMFRFMDLIGVGCRVSPQLNKLLYKVSNCDESQFYNTCKIIDTMPVVEADE